MKLHSHPSWARVGLFALGLVLLGVFLAAAAYGYSTLAVMAGCFCVVAVASAMGLVGRDHDTRHHHIPWGPHAL